MKLALLGALLGSGMFIGGFARHDVNYTGGPDYRLVEANGDRYKVPPGGLSAAGENHGFLIATAGAVILTVSLKQLWNQSKGEPELPYGKFQLSRDLTAGFTLWMIGANTHDYGRYENDGLVSRRNEKGEWGPYRDLRYQEPERLGFAAGTLGVIWMGAAAKHFWDTRGIKPVDALDRAMERIRRQVR